MSLEQRDKELAAIGASIGANCRPCIEHHLGAGRKAGLSQGELEDAVVAAHALRREAVEVLAARIEELLGHRAPSREPVAAGETSKAHELVALGVSVGANAHGLLHVHIPVALAVGFELSQVRSALKMAGYVQEHAAAITADEVAQVLAQQASPSTEEAAVS